MQYRRRVTKVQRTPRLYGDVHTVRRQVKKEIRIPWKVILGSLASIGLLYFFFGSSVFRVKTIEVSGASLADTEVLVSAIEKGESIWKNQQEAVEAIAYQDKRIASVSVLRGLPSTVQIQVVEYAPAAIWISGGVATLITRDGFAFAEYPEAQLDTDEALKELFRALPRMYDLANVAVELDRQVAGEPFVTFVTTMRSELERMTPQFQVQRIEIKQSLFDVDLVLDQGVRLSLSTGSDVGVQARNFARLVRDGVVVANTTVDLRVDRWAYVSGP